MKTGRGCAKRQMGGTKVSEAWTTIKNFRKYTRITLISLQEWENYYEILLTENRKNFEHKNIN